jgi:hypothetical protein
VVGAQAARVFPVTEETIASWLTRVDEQGEHALVQTPEPVNRFPDYVGYLVRWLKSMCPTPGNKRIAQVVARAGLHLGTTTVRRMLRKVSRQGDLVEAALPTAEGEASPISARVVTAKYPNHVLHVDLTGVPTAAGFWVPWIPFARPQGWPSGWWVAVVLDA